MNIPDPVIYALMVGAISTVGATFGSWLSSRATLKATQKAFTSIKLQIEFQHAAKIAEFRQGWINDLRESMATLQSIGVTPDLQHQLHREFYKAGTKIELLMNRKDARYKALQDCMYAFLAAETVEEKFRCNEPFVEVCQDILKGEWEVLKLELTKASAARAD
jgi:hypothetical protein